MAWTAPTTHVAGDILSASDWNTTVRDDLNWLGSGFPFINARREGVANYTGTNTTFADVDAANLILTVSPANGRFTVDCSCQITVASGAPIELDIILDSTTRYGSTNGAMLNNVVGTFWVAFKAVFTGLTNASHTFKLQARVTSAGTWTIVNNAVPINYSGWGF